MTAPWWCCRRDRDRHSLRRPARVSLRRQGAVQLALSAVAFGVAVSGIIIRDGRHCIWFRRQRDRITTRGLAASSQMLSLVGGAALLRDRGPVFLLSLVA